MHDHKPLAMESPADQRDVVKLVNEYFVTAMMGGLPSTCQQVGSFLSALCDINLLTVQ